MEVLPPDPCASPSLLASVDPAFGRAQDAHGAVAAAKPRTPLSSSNLLSRTRSNEGRRSAAVPHEVIPLTSTTSKSFNASHPPVLQPHQEHSGPRSRPGTATSQASSRFNPVTEDDVHHPRPGSSQAQYQATAMPHAGAHVAMGGSATEVAQRAAAAAGGGSRRYPAAPGLVAQLDDEHSEVPGTPASVASGRVGGGGTFFTDLRRSFADGMHPGVDESQDLGEEYEDAVAGLGGPKVERSQRGGLGSLASSRLNPMQSPSASEDGDAADAEEEAAYAEYAGDLRPDPAMGLDLRSDGGASSAALTEYSNPLMTPEESRAATPLPASAPVVGSSISGDTSTTEEARKSLLLVIRDLYVTEPQPPPSAEPSRPGTAAAPAPEVVDEEPTATDDMDVLAASRAAVAALAARADGAQSQRRSELGEYMTALQERKDDAGGRLVELPADWGVMLERLFRQRRAEYATLEGWLGPRRFEDLPINQLPSDHPDPKVVEGLARIQELDGMLNDKLIAALISHRETFPEEWQEQERRRLARHTKGVEDALKKERHKRLRAARIARAVTSLGEDDNDDLRASVTSMMSAGAQLQSIYSRLFTLKPEEEALVEAVLQRDDEESINPFDLDSAAAYAEGVGPLAGAGPAAASPDDIELELDMLLPSAASAAPTPSAASGAAAAALHRQFSSARGPEGASHTVADSGAEDRRPSSALPAFSASRPGTATGTGGLSAIAAAALHGHPALLAAGGVRDSFTAGSGLLPERVYEDPRAASRALRAINARLAAFESEHMWDDSGSLADFKSLPTAGGVAGAGPAAAGPAAPPGMQSPSGPGTVAAGARGPVGLPPRPPSPTRSAKSVAGGPAASVSTVTASGHKDYLREERITKEMVGREKDIDSALRQLKTGEVVRLGEVTLKALVEQCRRLQELNAQRRKAEDESKEIERRAPPPAAQPPPQAQASRQSVGSASGRSGPEPVKAAKSHTRSSDQSSDAGPVEAGSSKPVPRHNSAGSTRTTAPGSGTGPGARRTSDPAASGTGAAATATEAPARAKTATTASSKGSAPGKPPAGPTAKAEGVAAGSGGSVASMFSGAGPPPPPPPPPE
ncbi:hypothetical protein CHLRE_17g747897v5 [Chlamydomonas reinhardtii]|nr:uncharacterized protein CHLRE_17g747897v5 [Chlamydomonas reinhardtii]PNW71132.1 hypothetical protein CHLRE_17g747897v5 [Chlamydomonas reinhardtii]